MFTYVVKPPLSWYITTEVTILEVVYPQSIVLGICGILSLFLILNPLENGDYVVVHLCGQTTTELVYYHRDYFYLGYS